MRMLLKYIHDELLKTRAAEVTIVTVKLIFAVSVTIALAFLYARDTKPSISSNPTPIEEPSTSELSPPPPDWFKETIRQFKQGEL